MRILVMSALLLATMACSEESVTQKRGTSDSENTTGPEQTPDVQQIPGDTGQVDLPVPPVEPNPEPEVPVYIRPTTQPIVVAIGGWNSCEETPEQSDKNPAGMRTYAPMMNMLNNLEVSLGEALPYMAICLDNSVEFMKFYRSDKPDHLYNLPLRSVYDTLYDMAREQGRPLVLTGHSFGGWFAMDMARHKPDDIFIDLIATLDPISPVNCNPSDFADSLWSSFSGNSVAIGGCTEAPADFTVGERNLVRESTLSWVNYYQTENWTVLKSSAIPESHENYQVTVNDWSDLWNSHSKLGENSFVWNDIERRIESRP